MIKTLTCVSVTCDTCQKSFGFEDCEAHFPSVQEAIEAIGTSEQVPADCTIDSWVIGEDGSAMCDSCRQEAREAACPSHEWDDEPYPWRYCRLCHAWLRLPLDQSTDQEADRD